MLLPLLLLLSVSCTPEDDDPQTIAGTLVFSQGDNAGGITVALYPTRSLSSAGIDSIPLPFAIPAITPSILSLITEPPLVETVTDADGAFQLELPDAAQGILCLYDATYVYRLLDAAALPDLAPLTLNTGQTLSGNYNSAIVIAADTPVHISGDVLFTVSASLTLQPGVMLTFNNAADLQIAGGLLIAGSATAPVALFKHPLAIDPLLSINLFSNQSTTVNHAVLAGPVHISSQLEPLHLNSTIFFETGGIAVNQSLITDSLFIEDCIFLECETGIRLSDSAPAVIQNNAFLHCARAVHWNSSAGVLRQNQFFRDSLGVLFEGSATGKIEYNHFLLCREDISLYSNLFPAISYNESKESCFTFLFVRGGARPTLHYNNVLAPNDYLVYIYTASSLEGRVQAQTNFWDYTDALLIEEHIRDSLDQHDLLRVDYTGFLFEPVELNP